MKHPKLILKWMGIFLLFPSMQLFAQPDSISHSQSFTPAPNRSKSATTDTAMFRIIRSGDSKALKQKLAAGADANTTLDGFSALMLAALSGTYEEMKLLLDHGAKVNYANVDSLTALWMAVPDSAKTVLLLDHGADASMLSKEKYNVLVKLVNFPGTTSLFKTLVARGANPKRAARDNMLLYLAAGTNDTALLGLLLRQGFHPDDTIALGDYPIFFALFYRSAETVKMLVDNGANVNVGMPAYPLPNFKGITPLMFAALDDDEKNFYYLLDHGADVNAKCAKGYTALMLLQQSEIDHPAMTQALLERGARVSEKTIDGVNALSLALKKGNTQSVQLLQSSSK